MFVTSNLYQNDETWKATPLGNSRETIGSWGCLLTSVTMILNGFGYNETPATVNEKMRSAGGFQGAFFIPSVIPYIWPNCAYRDMTNCEHTPAPIEQIDAALAAGKPVVLQVDWSKDEGLQTHFVLVKEKKGNDYVIYDPYKYNGDAPGKEVLLTSRYKFNGARLESEISAVMWFDKVNAAPAPAVTKLPLPSEKFVVYTITNDLALRGEPSASGYLWKRLMAGSELICLEEKSKASAKVGAQGQWLQVQDPKGDQGFVAAWYVSDKKGGPAPSTAASSPSASPSTPSAPAAPAPSAPKPAVVPPGAIALYPIEPLSLRSKPIQSAETLLRTVAVTEQLISIEPSKDTIAKVGVKDKWIKVRDANRQEGYVAAWYVKYAGGSKAAATAAQPGGKVRTTAEAVSLRKEPVVNNTSLIKRVPLNHEFTIVEPGGEAKIGANNQWIKVKDATHEGYVAAWFLTR